MGGARTERIRTEIDRSSAYILDSGNVTSSYTSPSYSSSTLGRQTSFRDESSRVGRTRTRDSSIDCTTRIRHRSGSMDFSAPVKMRTRDHSVDYSSYSKPTYTANNRAPRPVTTNYDNDDDERSPEYKKIMGQTDVTLTISKYAKKDGDSLKVDGMIEEERRSKAYSKIIGQSSAQQLEKDAYRSTMCDLFADTKSFSAKTMQAINKECLYKEEKGPETAKKEEPKPVEETKPTPKWKKPVTAKKEEPKPAEEAKPTPKWKKPEAKKEETKTEVKEEEPIAVAPVEEVTPAVEEDNRLKPEVENTPSESAEKKEGEEEEDHYGMKAMAKEEQTKFSAMDEEFAAGASKLSALRQKMKALRMKHKAAAEADAAAEAARQG